VAALSVLTGCLGTPVVSSPTAARILADARAEGLSLQDPLALDTQILAEARRALPPVGNPGSRNRALVTFLEERGYLKLEYAHGRSLNAEQAYREHRGDCMAVALLYTALARHLGLDAYFVHVTEVRNYYEHAGWFFVSSHVAVGHGSGPEAAVVDPTREISHWRLAYYETIDDGAALALYYNNVAVDAMTAGRTGEAERLFRFLLAREPQVVELYNNLGVLLNRRGRHAEALDVLQRGITRFPAYEPLYTNALRATRELGREDLTAFYERRGQEVSHDDPYFLFARAVSSYERARYALAARQFERASEAKPDSPVILAWLARSYLSAGRRREGVEAFTRARRMAPGERVLTELVEKYPELRAPAQ
jgi:tetratricopeptide (TPR) repeat protein